jgi:hypothetical protein
MGCPHDTRGANLTPGIELRVSTRPRVQRLPPTSGAPLYSPDVSLASRARAVLGSRPMGAGQRGCRAIHPAVRNAEIALARTRPPSSLRAYDLVLQVYPKLWGHTAEDNEQAISILRQAIAIDPMYGRAHARRERGKP